ncbi:MAG TPA: hypothetical protein VF670_09125 [Duganella sp.]
MKSMYPRAGVALLLAATLSACGGGNDGNLLLYGQISNLTKSGMVLINRGNGEKLTVPSGATTFQFTRLLSADEQFNVDVETQPTGAKCELTQNTNKANAFTVSQTIISCTTFQYALGGTVKGLEEDGVASTNDGVTLANGPDTAYAAPSATPGADVPFAFANLVGNESPYGVTVLTQPANRTCTVVDGVGKMPLAGDYRNLVVNCVKK